MPRWRGWRARAVCTRALDNTWGAGVAFDPFDLQTGAESPLGVDISIQALTKYPSGGGDVLMGSVTTRDEALHQRLKACHMRSGWGVGGNDVEARAALAAVARAALRSTGPRGARARCLVAGPAGSRPGCCTRRFEGSPGHAHWKALCGDSAAGLFSIVMAPEYSTAQVDAFVDALQLFKIGYSWAGPVSLVVPYDLRALRGGAAPAERLVRFSVGLEAVDDLIADCEQALLQAIAGGRVDAAEQASTTPCAASGAPSRAPSRFFFSVSRLSCSALPLASAISALTWPPL